jgi:23S rRNA pseudouridine1911/1915/1917 synthase
MAGVPILHRDDHLVVVDKPAGLLVVPAPGRSGPTLVDLVTQQLHRRVQAVHRLDEDTTGAMVLALSDEGRSGMESQFRSHAVIRDYLALLTATPSPPAGRIEAALSESPDGIVRVVAHGGVRAVTHYETIARRGKATLVRCRLETGRRNQIRVHMAALGCAVVGDRKYGVRDRGDGHYRRVMLHSWSIRFDHPVSGRHIELCVTPREPELQP